MSPGCKQLIRWAQVMLFLGAFVYALGEGLSIEKCLRWGVAAGACSAMVWDIYRVEKRETEEMKEKAVVEKDLAFLW